MKKSFRVEQKDKRMGNKEERNISKDQFEGQCPNYKVQKEGPEQTEVRIIHRLEHGLCLRLPTFNPWLPHLLAGWS